MHALLGRRLFDRFSPLIRPAYLSTGEPRPPLVFTFRHLSSLVPLIGVSIGRPRCTKDPSSSLLDCRLTMPTSTLPPRPVRRDQSVDRPMHPLRLLEANEAPSPLRSQMQRVRLANGSYMIVRGRETPWISRDDFSENFTPSLPHLSLPHHRETQSMYWENTPEG